MNFSKLKLNEAASAPVQKAEADALESGDAQALSSQKGTTGQLKQRSQKVKPTESGEVGRDIIGTNEEYLRSLRTQKEILRLREEQKSDWKEDLNLAEEMPNINPIAGAANALITGAKAASQAASVVGSAMRAGMSGGDTKNHGSNKRKVKVNENLGNEQAQPGLPQMGQEQEQEDNHPYVEIMPSTQFKQKEAEAQIKAAAEKEKMSKMAAGLRGQSIGEAVTLQETRSDLNQELKNQAIEDDRKRQKGIRKARKANKKKATTPATPEEAGIKAGSAAMTGKAPKNYSG